MTETMTLSGKEYAALQTMFATVSTLSVLMPVLQDTRRARLSVCDADRCPRPAERAGKRKGTLYKLARKILRSR